MLNILKEPTYKKLAMVQFLIYFGSFFSAVAIYTLVIELEATPLQIAITTTTFLLPSLFGFFTGALVDKYLSKTFMSKVLFFEALFSSLILWIGAIEQFWLLIFFIFLRATCSFIFFASQMSLFPQIAKDEETLTHLNTIHSIVWSVNLALGMSLGGVVVYFLGVKSAIVIDVALFVIAYFIFLTINISLEEKKSSSIYRLIVEGIVYLKSHKIVLQLIVLHSSVALTNFDTIVNLLAKYHYSSMVAVSLSIGFLNATRAVALFLGAMSITKYINKKNLHLFLVMQGVFILLWALMQGSFYNSLISIFFVGILTTVLWSYTYTLMQVSIEKEYLGRVVAYGDTIFMAVSMSVSFLSGYFYDRGVSLEVITLTLGIGFLLFALYYRSYLRDKYLPSIKFKI